MEVIKTAVKNGLPNIGEELLDVISQALSDSGVESEDDLKYVQEADLSTYLKPIQCRKLLSSFQPKKSTDVSAPAVDVPAHTTQPSDSMPHQLQPQSVAPTQDPSWPDSMPIPWDKMSPGVRKATVSNKRPAPEERRAMVRVIVDEMKKYHPNPNLAQTSIVAKRVVRQYPDSFEDRTDDGERLASGYYVLAKQLKNRIENLNRSNELQNRLRRPRVKRSESGSEAGSQMSTPADSYGCIRWQPQLPEGETEATQQEKKQQLIETFSKDGPRLQTIAVDELMRNTYYSQRKDINAVPPCRVQELKDGWPFLFYQRWACQHFKELTGIACHAMLAQAIEKKGARIIRFFESQEESAKKEVRSVLRQIEAAKGVDSTQTGDAQAAGVLLLVMAQFNEKADGLVLLSDVSDSPDDVERSLDLPDTARLIIQGDSILTGKKWMMSVEGTVVSSSSPNSTFLGGLATLFSLYYVLNLRYEPKAECTLEFIQRCFLCINPEKGSKRTLHKTGKDGQKVTRKRENMNSHVGTFLKKLADFEWTS